MCRGPVRPGSRRCYSCGLHEQCAPGGLADLVVPVAYAIKGGPHARQLWQYKSGLTAEDRAFAAKRVLALLLVFMREHGACLCRAAGMGQPTHVAVVPSARARPGEHPLAELARPYVRLPWAEMSTRSGQHPVRELDPGRFRAAPLPGARVLLIDDTWTTGSTAQSAAMALRRAGACRVATVVLGRHLGLRDLPAGAAGGRFGLASFTANACAVCSGVNGGRGAAREP